jgi:hypothetical protein
MNEEQERIWRYLEENAMGYENHKSSSNIRDALELESGGVTNEHVRDLIRDMVLNHGCCIGSNSEGFWIIQTEEELNSTTNNLQSRVDEINNRIIALETNWRNQNQ